MCTRMDTLQQAKLHSAWLTQKRQREDKVKGSDESHTLSLSFLSQPAFTEHQLPPKNYAVLHIHRGM